MSITAKELAKKLNISAAAVSMALNDKPGVSTKTRKEIKEAAIKYGYDFSRINAKEKPKEDVGMIYFVVYRKHGALVPDPPVASYEDHGTMVPDVSFFAQLSEGIAVGCKNCHFQLNISYVYEGDDVEEILKNIVRFNAKGILLLGTEIQEHNIKPFLDCNLPLVLIDNYFETLPVNCVLINNVQGAFLATEALIRKKHAQPGYLKTAYSNTGFEERSDGFYKAIRKNGMSSSRSIIHKLPPTVEGAYSDMKELLSQNEPLANCYFADNDLIAAGAIKAFTEAGYKIPSDIAIIGFDDMPLCTYTTPTLSTVNVPKQYMGEVAVKRLAEIINSQNPVPVKIEINTSLHLRKSC